jgi:O-antigen/teichoic acid export membrane protein
VSRVALSSTASAGAQVTEVVGLEARKPVTRNRRATPAGAILLSSATVSSGVLAYVFHVAAARTLGASLYGLVAALWAAMFITIVVLFRPLEQTTSRAIADRVVRGEEVRSVVRSVTFIYVVLACVIAAGGLLFFGPLNRTLFLGHSAFTIALLVGTIAYGAAYVVRGACSGLRWFNGYGIGLLADGGVRLLVLVPVVLLGTGRHAAAAVAAAAVAAAALGGAIAPLAAGRRELAPLLRRGIGVHFHLGSAAAFAAPAAAIAAADQLLVNGGPLFVMLSGGEDAGKVAGVVFAATMIVRIPVFVFTGLAASLLPNLTKLNAEGDTAGLRSLLERALFLFSAFAVGIVVFGATIGPPVLSAVYGSDFRVGRLPLALLGVAAGGYLAAATLAQALLALDRGRVAALVWCAAAVGFVLGYLFVPGDQMMRIAISTAAATVGIALVSTVLLVRRRA